MRKYIVTALTFVSLVFAPGAIAASNPYMGHQPSTVDRLK